MPDWSRTNIAHRRTYMALRVFEQTRRKFASAGTAKMPTLKFWVSGDSSAIRRGKARRLATSINRLFIRAYRSKYEDGFTKVKSINAMTNVLVKANNTVENLANAADVCYDFFGEDDV